MPVILICLLGIATTAIFGQRVGWRGFMEKKLADNKRVEQLPPEQKERVIEQQTKFAPLFGYIGLPIGLFVGAVVIGGVLLGAFNGLAGAQLDLKTSMSIVTYSWMPGVIQQILGILILFVKSPDTIDLEHLVASNCGAFLADDAPKWLMSLCTSLDIFTFWTLFLAALGFAVARPKKISMGRALGTVIGLWVFWVVVKMGLASVFS